MARSLLQVETRVYNTNKKLLIVKVSYSYAMLMWKSMETTTKGQR